MRYLVDIMSLQYLGAKTCTVNEGNHVHISNVICKHIQYTGYWDCSILHGLKSLKIYCALFFCTKKSFRHNLFSAEH
jgi:hypothetical protein